DKLMAKARSAKPATGQNAEVFAAQIDTDLAKLQENLKHDVAQLEKIRDLARSELKSLKKMQVISELEYRDLSLKYGPVFEAGIGSEAIFGLVKQINLEELGADLERELVASEGTARRKVIKRLKLVKS